MLIPASIGVLAVIKSLMYYNGRESDFSAVSKI